MERHNTEAGLGGTSEGGFLMSERETVGRQKLCPFLALPVIPELKITDLGLVDVVKGELVGQEV